MVNIAENDANDCNDCRKSETEELDFSDIDKNRKCEREEEIALMQLNEDRISGNIKILF